MTDQHEKVLRELAKSLRMNAIALESDDYLLEAEALTALLDDREKMVDEIQSLKDSLLAAEAEIDGFASMLDSAN